ncbi:MAG TPA: undecaprenyldiphospho-muramoylpentapeptide beta-N-acetylglucosaminyltransferase [Salinivirgaceae bacterium]|nr:undecaprenyldiphospho-muramoylpentapeptide beta-N-acetylglucosaminyltransferase [Salinivirgaceae bacterium]
MNQKRPLRLLISAGGTGGHIYPALAVASEIRQKYPDAQILFVGAQGKMEMEKVPKAGFDIVGLPVKGMPRRLSFKMVTFVYSLIMSLLKARKLIRNFKPDVAAGFGGFASGPVLAWAGFYKIPYIIQEQNSYPGITNKLLARRASKICVAYDSMDRFFPIEKIVVTGNPVRSELYQAPPSKIMARQKLELNPDKTTVLVLGGSLGARSINNQILSMIKWFQETGYQLLWQTGSLYYEEMVKKANLNEDAPVKIMRFIDAMELAFSAADIIITRAGAGTISELCLVGKPVILIPSPNVAEDHQTHNARALSEKHAAILLPDNKIETLAKVLEKTLNDRDLMNELSENIRKLAKPLSSQNIAAEIMKCVKQ